MTICKPPTMEPTPVDTLGITRSVLSEALRIIKVNYSHFVALSFFFLPLSFSLIITPTLIIHSHKFPSNHPTIVISYLLYIVTAYTLSLCAIATITYSTYHALLGEQVNFLTSLKSLTSSFFPILSTAVVANVLLLLISICFLMFAGGILMFAQNIGFLIDYNSVYFMWFSGVVGLTLMAIMIYFYVKWSLAFVVVVVESKWGLAPLIRSSYLVKGMRSVSFLVILYFGTCAALFVWIYSSNDYLFVWIYSSNDYLFMSLSAFVVLTMLFLFFITISCFLRIAATNSVLYVHCKALHGESSIDMINEGFVPDYINLPSNDQKVSIA